MSCPDEARPVAVVTGASAGLGRAAAIALAQSGFNLALTDLDAGLLDETLKLVCDVAGARVFRYSLDLRDQTQIERFAAEVEADLGGIDVLVNNAGTPWRGSALDISRDDWSDTLAVNVTGSFFMSQRVARSLVRKKKPGCIINLASTFGLVGVSGVSAYGVSKGAIVQMTRILAAEWATHNIRVNAVAPATVETATRAPVLANEAVRTRLLSMIPLGRFGREDEIGHAIAFLASPKSAFITGHILSVDGGFTAV